MKNVVYLLIGGNLGDRYQLIKDAKTNIESEVGFIIRESSIYETAAWGFESDNDFLNQVLIVETNFNPHQVLEKCHLIENQLGRVRESEHYTSRTMDIDILFYNTGIINEQDLIIPHQQLHKRRFTLEPLNEISPDYLHPKLNKTINNLLKECSDLSDVRKV